MSSVNDHNFRNDRNSMAETLICTQNWLRPSLGKFNDLNLNEEFEISENIVTEFQGGSTNFGGAGGSGTTARMSSGCGPSTQLRKSSCFYTFCFLESYADMTQLFGIPTSWCCGFVLILINDQNVLGCSQEPLIECLWNKKMQNEIVVQYKSEAKNEVDLHYCKSVHYCKQRMRDCGSRQIRSSVTLYNAAEASWLRCFAQCSHKCLAVARGFKAVNGKGSCLIMFTAD